VRRREEPIQTLSETKGKGKRKKKGLLFLSEEKERNTQADQLAGKERKERERCPFLQKEKKKGKKRGKNIAIRRKKDNYSSTLLGGGGGRCFMSIIKKNMKSHTENPL